MIPPPPIRHITFETLLVRAPGFLALALIDDLSGHIGLIPGLIAKKKLTKRDDSRADMDLAEYGQTAHKYGQKGTRE